MGAPESIQTAEWILNTAVQCLLILGLGCLFIWSFRHRAAPLRSGISLMAILAVLLLPFFSGLCKTLNYTSFPVKLTYSIAPASTTGIDIAMGRVELPATDPETKKMGFFSRFWSGPAAAKYIILFGIVWGMGFIFLLLRFIAGIASIHILKKNMKELDDPRLCRLMEDLGRTFPRRLRTKVYASSQVHHPMAVGIIKPFVLIPEHLLNKLQDSELRGILLHELSHIHHRDQLTGVLQRFVTALNWWNPFAFVLSAAHSKAREEISDNHVLLQNNSKEYAECLINLAEKTNLFKRIPVSAGLASPHIPLKERVKHILSKERIMDTNLKKSTIGVMVLAAFLVLIGIAGSRLTFATSENEPAMEKADTEFSAVQEKDQKKAQEKEKSEKQDVKPPELIKKVDPVYPAEARKAGIEGAVTLEAATDKFGRVESVKVLKSVPELDQAAIDAVKQWVYEPMVIDGKPHGVVFTVTCRFSLDDKNSGKSFEGGVVGTDEVPPVRAIGDIKPPKLIKKVDPVYPPEAKEAGIEGIVIVEATTDIYGRVVDTTVLRSIPELDQAAIDAVKQWVYEPEIIDGIPRGLIFTVTCTFKLKESVRAVGDVKPPKLIKKVEPIYPEEAKKAGIGGVVILEVTTDIYGRVVHTKVLQSVSELNQAAIDAVKQWVYEPEIIDGEPQSVVFTVTVTFKIK
jgi:TonB family protein